MNIHNYAYSFGTGIYLIARRQTGALDITRFSFGIHLCHRGLIQYCCVYIYLDSNFDIYGPESQAREDLDENWGFSSS